MKRFFYFICGVLMICGMTACNSVKPAIAYNLTVTGDGDGNVKVEFPVGHYYMNGTAALDLLVSNDTTTHTVLAKDAVLTSNNSKQISALKTVNDFVANSVSASTTAGGTYDLSVDGIVYEPITGLSFSVHKHLTNRDSTVTVTASDPYPFVR